MCTSILYKNGDYSYFGRNLDLQYAMGNEVIVAPRNHAFPFRHLDEIKTHPAIVGMAINENGFPLFFEGMNEYGVGIAGLNFPGFAWYNPEVIEGKTNVASFELIPYLLSTCKNVADLKKELANLNITNDAFSAQYQPSPLHWLMADKDSCIVVEQTKDGLKVYDNPLYVLTNAPEYPSQYYNFCNYLNLTGKYPVNRIAPNEKVDIYSTAMGSFGIPGGLDSASRFVRVGFTLANARAENTDEGTLTQYFHNMQSVAQSDGTNQTSDGLYEITQYTSGCNLATMDFYWTSYKNQQISGLHVKSLDLDQEDLICYPVEDKQEVKYLN